ncbi:MAG: hypothetical protein SGPRY_002891 [Prymnesium sp.]
MLPLYQLSLGQLDAGVVVSLGSVGSRKEDGLKRVVSSLSLHIGANHFNPTNGEWEPMIEEWSMRAELEADFAEEEKIELIVEAPRPLQVNVSHAQLITLMDTSALMESLLQRLTTVVTSGVEPPTVSQRGHLLGSKCHLLQPEVSVCYRSCAIRNQTGCEVQVSLEGALILLMSLQP